jgi:hypothetical protein
MGAEENSRAAGDAGNANARRKRRRRRRNRRPDGAEGGEAQENNSGRGQRGGWRGRDDNTPAVAIPRTGRVPRFRLAVHPSKGRPANSIARRRRLGRAEMDALAEYLNRLPDSLLGNLYRGMGGQPGRVPSKDRMIQLAVRAIAQGNRLSNLARSLHQRDRQALAILVQCGGLAQIDEFKGELILSLGGHEREWSKVLANLSDRGLIASSEVKDGHSFVLIPEPLIEHLAGHLREDLTLPDFEHEDVRVLNERAFQPPLDFSIVSLATYIDQHPPRLTQRHDIFKVHKDEMDQFFSQLWEPDSELFSFHIEFLMMHGMVELRGDRLSVNRAVIEEWLQLDRGDQHDLVFAALDRRFPLAEWILWAIHDADGAWIPERPLSALYRRWRRGEDWRERYHNGQWATPRTAQREGFTFTPLLNSGMLELGQWGQEKFYRLTPRARRLLEPEEEDGFSQFYLTPNFEIMAPAGMAPIQFFRVGELAELTACDRANTYRITEVTIEQAIEKGWRRDDVLEFLRDNSQIGLPENVETTLRGWMGHVGDVEFHDVKLITVHRSQIRRLESARGLKPYLLHRFVPGMYAVDASRLDKLNAELERNGFRAAPRTHQYPDDPAQVDARERLIEMVTDARAARQDLVTAAHKADSDPEQLQLVAGSGHGRSKRARKKNGLPPRASAAEVREICERAIQAKTPVQVLYVGRDDTRKLVRLDPERVAVNSAGQYVLVARDIERDARLSYQITQIERIGPAGK